MNDQQLSDLAAEEARLWAVCNQADEAYKKASSDWCAVHTLRKHELLRREIVAQIEAENKPQEERV